MNVGKRGGNHVAAEKIVSDDTMVEEIINYVMSLEERKRKYRGTSSIGKGRRRNIADALEHMAHKNREHIRNFVDANWSETRAFEDQNFNSMADILSKDLDLRSFCVDNFMLHCCRISLLASYMYDYDFNKAPMLAKRYILTTIDCYKCRKLFDINKWRYLNSSMFHYLVDNDVLK